MKKLITILFLFNVAFAQTPVFQPVAFQKAPAAGCDNYRLVTVDHTKVPNTDRTDFPLLFTGTYAYLKSTANGGKVEDAQGDDIRFTTNTAYPGTNLNFEIEKWDAATGEIVAWIKVPTLTTATDYTFYIHYGASGISTFQGGSAGSVWNSNYKVVQHFEGSLNLNDETTNANNATNAGSVASIDGKFGKGADFPGSSSDYLTIADANSLTNSTIYVSGWVNADGTSGAGAIIDKYQTSYEYEFGFGSSLSMYMWAYDNTNGGYLGRYTSTGMSTSGWHHMAAYWDGTTGNTNGVRIYLDGTRVDNADFAYLPGFTALRNTTQDVEIGRGTAGLGGPFNGWLDEVRQSIMPSNVIDWIVTEYNNQSSPSTFYSLAAETIIYC